MDQVYIVKVVGVGGKYVFVVNVEIVIQLEVNFQIVIDMLIVVVVYIFQMVVYKVWLNRFNSVLIDWEFIVCKIFNFSGVIGKVIMYIGFFGGEEVLILVVVEGEGLVIWGLVQCGIDDILVIGFVVGV